MASASASISTNTSSVPQMTEEEIINMFTNPETLKEEQKGKQMKGDEGKKKKKKNKK